MPRTAHLAERRRCIRDDSLRILYAGDSADEVIHQFTVGTQFPATPVGTATPLARESRCTSMRRIFPSPVVWRGLRRSRMGPPLGSRPRPSR